MICCKTNTVCPKCQHQFPAQWTSCYRGRHDLMSGGGLIETTTPSTTTAFSPSAINFFISPPQLNMSTQPAAAAATTTQQVVHVVHHHHHHHIQPAPVVGLLRHENPVAGCGPAVDLQRHSPPTSPTTPPPPDTPSPDTVRALRHSGWYYEGLTYLDSQELLKDRPLGTFIVRDSSDPRFLYSLSVQTERGPTSVRIHYVHGAFRLDSQQDIQSLMPTFATVIELVDYYVEQSQRSATSPHVWVDPKGKMYSPITLSRPLVKEGQTPATLKHLARLAVNGAMKRQFYRSSRTSIFQLELPASVSEYLIEYPYAI